jgi:hypothetical protein
VAFSSSDQTAWLRSETFAALHRLAAPADSQIRELCAGHPDELALDLDAVLDAYVATGALRDEQIAALRELDAQLDRMSGKDNAELWTPEGLRDAPEWAEVRRLAAHASELLS